MFSTASDNFALHLTAGSYSRTPSSLAIQSFESASLDHTTCKLHSDIPQTLAKINHQHLRVAENDLFNVYLSTSNSSKINLKTLEKRLDILKNIFTPHLRNLILKLKRIEPQWEEEIAPKLFPFSIDLTDGNVATGQPLSFYCLGRDEKNHFLKNRLTIRLGFDKYSDNNLSLIDIITHEFGHLIQYSLKLHPMSLLSESFADFIAQIPKDFNGVFDEAGGPQKILKLKEEFDRSDITMDEKVINDLEKTAVSYALRDFRQNHREIDIYKYPQPHWISIPVNSLIFQLGQVLSKTDLTRSVWKAYINFFPTSLSVELDSWTQSLKKEIHQTHIHNDPAVKKIFTDWSAQKTQYEDTFNTSLNTSNSEKILINISNNENSQAFINADRKDSLNLTWYSLMNKNQPIISGTIRNVKAYDDSNIITLIKVSECSDYTDNCFCDRDIELGFQSTSFINQNVYNQSKLIRIKNLKLDNGCWSVE